MTDPTSDLYNEHMPPEDKHWIVKVLLLTGAVVLAGFILWWLWDTFQVANDAVTPAPSPTISEAPPAPK
jgi:hypothetical protein